MPIGIKGFQKGENNPLWKGNNVHYSGLHAWVRRNLIKQTLCQNCFKKVKLDIANKSGMYLRKLSDWEWLCRKCHMIEDGRMERRGDNGQFRTPLS